MSTVALPKKAFPTDAITKILSGWWISKTQSPLKEAPKTPVKGTVFALQPELSSQQAVGVLVACKAVLGYRPSKDTIKKGGYSDKNDFVTTLLQQIKIEFDCKQPAPQSAQTQEGVLPDATVAY
ncbi:hypothetical protein [Terriglobus albidus]|uniref:hypothetical protein n=1 Tax=Terriglobus albidus TaxID=1592106 RepID=UPI0021E042D5|nr:hypothetical protein [Terriglobus albidus]